MISPTAKGRKASVSFDNTLPRKTNPVKAKTSQQPEMLRSASRAVSSAGSAISTASTWSFSSRPASSMTALRSRVILTIDKALSLLSEYYQNYLIDPDDDFQGVYQEFVRQLLVRLGYKNDLADTEHLHSVVIRKFQTDPSISKRADFRALKIVCARAKEFKNVKSQVQARIDEVSTYTESFCVTFSHECEGFSFDSVENYENLKVKCLKEYMDSLASVQAGLDELKGISPLFNYLESYSRVLHHIEHIIQSLSTAAKSLKKWIIADKHYEKSLEKEISYLKQRLHSHISNRTTMSSLKYEAKACEPKEEGKSRRVELTLSNHKSSVEKLRDLQKSLNRSISEVKENQREARRQLVAVERQTTRRIRAEDAAGLKPTVDRLKNRISALQEEEDKLLSRLNDVNTRLTDSNKEILSLEQDLVRQKRRANKRLDHVRDQRAAFRMQIDASSTISHKIRVLQKIKSLKQDKEILRKMEFNMINIDYKEAMQTAIREIASKVGYNWPDVYKKLPFLPPRTQDKLDGDIAGILTSGAQMDKSPSDMAIMAFEKWAKRSVSATVNELLFAAKRFVQMSEKQETIRRTKNSVPRIRKRFDQFRLKANVIYV